MLREIKMVLLQLFSQFRVALRHLFDILPLRLLVTILCFTGVERAHRLWVAN